MRQLDPNKITILGSIEIAALAIITIVIGCVVYARACNKPLREAFNLVVANGFRLTKLDNGLVHIVFTSKDDPTPLTFCRRFYASFQIVQYRQVTNSKKLCLICAQELLKHKRTIRRASQD